MRADHHLRAGIQAALFVAVLFIACEHRNSNPAVTREDPIQWARIQDQSGNLFATLEALQSALARPETRQAAQAYLDAIDGRRREAETYLKSLALKLSSATSQSRFYQYYYEQGICYELLDQPEQALNAFTTSLQFFEDNAMAWLHRALIEEQLGDTVQADTDMAAALACEFVPPSIRFQAALWALRRGRPAQARQQAEILSAAAPQYAELIHRSLVEQNSTEDGGD
jgi:tetratricopeptide (TPR) repeat protein